MVCFPINLWIRFDCTLHIETEVCYSHMHLYYYAWNRSEYRYSLVSIAYFTCIQRVQRSRIRKTASASLREWQKLENRKKNRNNRRCVSHVRGHWQHQFRIIEEQWQQQQQQIQHVANLQRSDCVMFGSSRSPFSHQQQQQQQARSMFVAHNTQHPISPVMFGFGFWLATLPVCIHYAGYQVKFNSYTTANNQHKHTAAKTYYRLFTAQLNIQQFRRAFALADYRCEIGRTSTRTGANTLTHTERTEPTKVPLCPTSTISTLVDWGGWGGGGICVAILIQHFLTTFGCSLLLPSFVVFFFFISVLVRRIFLVNIFTSHIFVFVFPLQHAFPYSFASSALLVRLFAILSSSPPIVVLLSCFLDFLADSFVSFIHIRCLHFSLGLCFYVCTLQHFGQVNAWLQARKISRARPTHIITRCVMLYSL